MYILDISDNKNNCIRNLKTCTNKEVYIVATLNIIDKINELSLETICLL